MPDSPALTGDWWKLYGDATLDKLETRIETDNPTLAGALGRYDEARGYQTQARAALYPRIGVGADITANRQSDNRPLRGNGEPDLYPVDTVGGDASYELDLWGRVRNSVAAGKAQVQAGADDLAAIRLSLECRLASSYVTLREMDQQAALMKETVDAFAQADVMTRKRFDAGISTGIETAQSGAQLSEAQAQLSDVENSRALTEHAIASLVATPASSFSLAAAQALLPIPDVPVTLPSVLVQHRPDVAAAERRMYAANRGIGIAKAAFFPAITLGGQAGFQNAGLPGLLTAQNILWSVGPGAALSLFDGGRRRGRMAVARATWSQATADYRVEVLKAFRQVEDGLSRLHHLGDEQTAEDRAVQQAGEAERLSLDRYERGASNYLVVVMTQTAALRARRQALALRTERLQASIDLIRAIGGGWSPHA